MLVFLLVISILVLLVDISLIILWLTNYKDSNNGIKNTPFVSILIAARNEEDNLVDCLRSLLDLDYPDDKYEILIGNDKSEDKTGDIADAFSIRYKQIKSFTIYKKLIKGNGKANVLAQLVPKSKGELLFITDADIRFPQKWIQAMLSGMSEDIALVTGTSVVVGSNLLAYMQQIDWLFATGMLKVVSDLDIPVTTMGNNMLIRKKVYEEIGGYEAMPFSVTEDLELFNHIKEDYKTINLFNPNVLNESMPIKSLGELLIQRKRWMRGAFELPLIMIALLTIQSSFFAIIIGLVIINPIIAAIVLASKFTFRYIFLSLVVRKLKDRVNIFGSLIFEVYTSIFSLVSLLYYLIPGPIEWKGRKY
jgi:cellulose synthase/poly-beta-1,6-N-acetylglucosamine synthase-like glycosyltransferase